MKHEPYGGHCYSRWTEVDAVMVTATWCQVVCVMYSILQTSYVRFAEGGMHKAKLVKQERFTKASEGHGLSSGWLQL